MQRDQKASRAIYEPHFWYSSPPVTFSATRYEEVAANYLALIHGTTSDVIDDFGFVLQNRDTIVYNYKLIYILIQLSLSLTFFMPLGQNRLSA